MSRQFPPDRRRNQWYEGRSLGLTQRPPLPQHIVLTDRDDGKLWHLSWTNLPPNQHADGHGYIAINDTLPDTKDLVIYPAFEGPALNTVPRVRLMVRGGYLGYDYSLLPTPQTDRDQARIIARRGLQKLLREIIIPSGWKELELDELGWTPFSV